MSVNIKFEKINKFGGNWHFDGNTLKDGSGRDLHIAEILECQGLGKDGKKVMRCFENMDMFIDLVNAILDNKDQIHTRAWNIAERINK